MFNLNKIKQKSDTEKRSFAFVAATIITSVIVIVWVITVLPRTINNIGSSKEEVANTYSPIANIMGQFKEVFGGKNPSN